MHGHETPQGLLKELSVIKKDKIDDMLKVLKAIEAKNKINDFPIHLTLLVFVIDP